MRFLLTMVLAALIPTSEAEVIRLSAPGVEGKSLLTLRRTGEYKP